MMENRGRRAGDECGAPGGVRLRAKGEGKREG